MNKFCLVLLTLTFTTLACVRIDLSSPPPAQPILAAMPRPTATPWPTMSPRPTATPLPAPVVFVVPQPACFVPVLEVGQHIAASGSYTATERTASTPMLCHLERESCGYNQLVGILDPTIVFKEEEEPPYNTEDILMHPAMLLPLSRLNQLVKAEWNNAFQLRVTDAYDSLLEHDPPESEPSHRYSLHYEGRAIDLTLWPIDQSQYGRLCALAHCAGFDWVNHEGHHCHASIRANSLCTACTQ